MSNSTAAGPVPAASGERSPLPLTPFEAEVVALFVGFSDKLGLPKSLGEIYGLLYGSASALAFQEIVDKLALSKGSVSQGLKVLRGMGVVRIASSPGDKRDRYVPETELRNLVSVLLRERVQPLVTGLSNRMGRLKTLASRQADPKAAGGDAEILLARVEKLDSWQLSARAVVPMAAKLFG